MTERKGFTRRDYDRAFSQITFWMECLDQQIASVSVDLDQRDIALSG
jgi:hypothetical protein